MRLLIEARLEIRVEVLEGERVISAVVPVEGLDSVSWFIVFPLLFFTTLLPLWGATD